MAGQAETAALRRGRRGYFILIYQKRAGILPALSFVSKKALQFETGLYNTHMKTHIREAVPIRINEPKTRNNRRTGEPRRVHNFRLSTAASDKLRKLAADYHISQGAIIERLICAVNR